jgi:hypothetical protein
MASTLDKVDPAAELPQLPQPVDQHQRMIDGLIDFVVGPPDQPSIDAP